MSSSEPIRVLLADDHALVRIGLEEGLKNHTTFELIRSVSTGTDAINSFKLDQPDVALIDFRMPGANGNEVIESITDEYPDAKVIILSAYEGEEDIWRAAEAGALGYITKGVSMDEIFRALITVAKGGTYFPLGIQEKIEKRKNRKNLTRRETQVLGHLSSGMSNKKIMAEMGLSAATVRLHVSNVLAKLNATDRTEAVVKAVQRGIVHLDE